MQSFSNVLQYPEKLYCLFQINIDMFLITFNFNVDMNNVSQYRNNFVIFKVKFHNVDERRNNVVNMTMFKKLKKRKKYFWASKKR